MCSQWVALAEVSKPHGVRGEVRLKVYNLDSDVLLSKPRTRLAFADGSTQAIRIQSIRPVPGAMLARLGGVDNREEADALRGVKLEVQRQALAPIEDDDEFYVQDLVGCRALLEGEELGRVVDVFAYPTMDVLVIERSVPEPPPDDETKALEGKGKRGKRKRRRAPRLEIPMQGAYVGAVDLSAGTVEILTLEGLS